MESPFTLAAGPDTDIWKKPPSHDVFTAPYRPHTTAPLPHFLSATLTFTTTYTHQFDQAGLLLVFNNPAGNSPRKWIKTGIELFNGSPRLSTVCCDAWADWSVASPPSDAAEEIRAGKRSVTVAIEKEESASGKCLWVYQIDGDKKIPLREVCWVYGDNGGEGWELEVGAVVARPGKDTTEALEVKFVNFEVKWEKP